MKTATTNRQRAKPTPALPPLRIQIRGGGQIVRVDEIPDPRRHYINAVHRHHAGEGIEAVALPPLPQPLQVNIFRDGELVNVHETEDPRIGFVEEFNRRNRQLNTGLRAEIA